MTTSTTSVSFSATTAGVQTEKTRPTPALLALAQKIEALGDDVSSVCKQAEEGVTMNGLERVGWDFEDNVSQFLKALGIKPTDGKEKD